MHCKKILTIDKLDDRHRVISLVRQAKNNCLTQHIPNTQKKFIKESK